MSDGDAGDWELDLRPARRAAPRQTQSTDNAGTRSLAGGEVSVDIVAALADLRRSVDRIERRIAAIENVLVMVSEDGAAVEGWLAAVHRVRSDLARPRPVALSDERRTRARTTARTTKSTRGTKDKPIVERASGD